EIPSERLLSHTKGCYPGQEVVVRVRDRGHVNRHLRGLLVDGDEVPAPGAEVVADGTVVGRVTSATRSLGLQRPIALAFVRRQHAPGAPVGVRADAVMLPPTDRHGLPGFSRLLQTLAEAWATRRADVLDNGRQLAASLGQESRLRAAGTLLTDEVLFSAFQAVSAQFDEEHGGLGGAPKFPQPMIWEFVLRFARRSDNPYARRMVHTTLVKMARGGMYDQLGGGFARYSVDPLWLVPHFEKMLYDNAQLASLYLHAWQAFADPESR